MKKYAFLLGLMAIAVQASELDNAYQQGMQYGQQQNNAEETLSQANPKQLIPNYTEHPVEADNYGGVTQTSSDIGTKGQQAFNGSEVGKSIISNILNNRITIKKDAPFIVAGNHIESAANRVTSASCETVDVNKVSFTNSTCVKGANTFSQCTRHASVGLKTVHDMKDVPETGSGAMSYTYVVQHDGVLKKAELTINHVVFPKDTDWGSPPSVTVLGKTVVLNRNGSLQQVIDNVNQSIKKGTTIPIVIHYSYWVRVVINGRNGLSGSQLVKGTLSSGKVAITLTIHRMVAEDVPYQQWTSNCPISNAVLSSSQCIAGKATKSTSKDGVNYPLTADCWQYQDTYITPSADKGSCAALDADKNCTLAERKCTQTDPKTGVCLQESATYQCQTTTKSTGQVCGGNYFCQTGDCAHVNPQNNAQFNQAVAALAGVADAAGNIKNDQQGLHAFTGKSMSCRKAFAGFSDCCADGGWGQGIGLTHCSSEEKGLGVAKEKRLTISVGDKCDRKVAGVCLQHSQVYCVFDSKLARIIQEQGRAAQLGVGFGDGDTPNCRGVAVNELQKISFDKIDFSDYYHELQNNLTIPDANKLAGKIKQQITHQLQGGSQ